MDCYTCKKHLSQGGKCYENSKNCLFYEKEPRGRMVKTEVAFEMDSEAETPIIKAGSKVIFEENGRELEFTIKKINMIDMKTMTCSVEAEYHENEMPKFEKIKMFKVVN